MAYGPPSTIEPSELFALLMQADRPWRALEADCDFLGDELRVQSLTSSEFARALAPGGAVGPWGRAIEQSQALIAATLCDGPEPLFRDAVDVAGLTVRESHVLLGGIGKALRVCSPMYADCDRVAWSEALKEGAGSRANQWRAYDAYQCQSSAQFGKYTRALERADTFFGKAVIELTDGQLMAYRAAVSMMREQLGDGDK